MRARVSGNMYVIDVTYPEVGYIYSSSNLVSVMDVQKWARCHEAMRTSKHMLSTADHLK